jgi:NAD(P)-dependent dehydrogenase (short-subunit alcohol dehydrogenase family)
MVGKLDGKVAIVTGGSSGIGRATAVAFAKEGAKVVVAARRNSEGEETVRLAKEAGGEALFVQTDVTKAVDIEALVNKTLETYSRLDCAFNNAGSGKANPLTQMSESDWDFDLAVNLKAVWLCMKYEIPAMLRSGAGAIVNMASQGAIIGVPNFSSYCAAKGGVISLSRTAAIEYAQDKIRVNIVSPGAIKTELLSEIPADQLQEIEAAIPLKRAGQPEEIAAAVAWLCSDSASFVTGQNLAIDGGYTAQ